MSGVVIRSARPVPVSDLLSLPGIVRHLWHYRYLIGQFTRREVLVRHKGTSLGLLWAIVQPLITLAVYTFIFGMVFQNKSWHEHQLGGPPWTNFVLHFFVGFILYGFFADCVNRAPGLITEHPNLVRKVMFPVEILPVIAAGAGLVYSAVAVALLLVATLAVTGTVSWTLVFLPVVTLPLAMLTLGLSWFLASMGVFIRDMKQVVPVLTQLLFFVTPVFYDVDGIPEQFRPIIELNPLTVIITNGRRCLLWNEMPDWPSLGIVTAFSLVVMVLGYAWFAKGKRGLADVI
jgi:lipopolysaccharide transport system permease protein